MQKRTIIGALLACLIFSPLRAETPPSTPAAPAHPKTFVAVLWPMFGPLPAIGLVELVAEIKMMPNVQVETYVHQAWPSLVDDLNALPPGTRSIVIGYSLGANSTAEVANRVKHVDEFIALQPSLLSWNPDIKGGTYGRFVEIYNPNKWETWGGMGSKKLVGPNIDYIANHDSHPGAQFSGQFRDLVRTDIARLTAPEPVELAQADAAPPARADDGKVTEATEVTGTVQPADDGKAEAAALLRSDAKATQADPKAERANAVSPVKATKASAPPLAKTARAAPAPVTHMPPPKSVAVAPAKHVDTMAFLDRMSGTVTSGDLSAERPLTAAAMMDYAKRTYHVHPDATASCLPGCGDVLTP